MRKLILQMQPSVDGYVGRAGDHPLGSRVKRALSRSPVALTRHSLARNDVVLH